LTNIVVKVYNRQMERIIFSGEWDKHSMDYYVSHAFREYRVAMLIALILCLSSQIILGALSNGYRLFAIAFSLTLLILFTTFISCPKIFYPRRILYAELPYIITIEKEKIVCDSTTNNAYYSKELKDVKKVVDFGSFYCVSFYFSRVKFICQKDLIIQGTIEEFEETFSDVIVRKK
ncbi:MAG: hypothetical protein J5697_03475, partial [Clostridia bacterium]|nr:hypothetical protein [Clostridia bacterium]